MIKSLLGQSLETPVFSEKGRQVAEENLAVALKNFEAEPNLENTVWYGRRLAYLFRFEEAFAVYGDGIERFPEAHELYRHRGHRYISTRQFERAVADFERAAELAADQPVTVEPDGAPNRLNQPTSNSHFNIWYHLGLSYYLQRRWETAVSAYQTCLQYSNNPDSITATLDWLYMSYRRLGDKASAEALLPQISEEMEIVETASYHNRLLMYKGLRSPESLLNPTEESAEGADMVLVTQGYGVGNWYLYNGEVATAKSIFERVLQGKSWSAFGYIASEVEMLHL